MKPSELIRQRGWCPIWWCPTNGAIHITEAWTSAWAECASLEDMRIMFDNWASFKGAFKNPEYDYRDWENDRGRTADEVIAKLEEFDL